MKLLEKLRRYAPKKETKRRQTDRIKDHIDIMDLIDIIDFIDIMHLIDR